MKSYLVSFQGRNPKALQAGQIVPEDTLFIKTMRSALMRGSSGSLKNSLTVATCRPRMMVGEFTIDMDSLISSQSNKGQWPVLNLQGLGECSFQNGQYNKSSSQMFYFILLMVGIKS